MERINENKLAVAITDSEGMKRETDIGQVKEVLKIALDILAVHMAQGNAAGVMELIERHRTE